jgi:hypothetical protein
MVSRKNSVKKRKAVIFIILGMLVLGAAATFFYYTSYYLLDYKELNTSVKIVASGAGFNVDPTSLTFGKNYPGGSELRYINLYSKQDARVHIVVKGAMKSFVTFEPNDFILEKNSTAKITAQLDVPLNTSLGNYTGIVKIYFLRP